MARWENVLGILASARRKALQISYLHVEASNAWSSYCWRSWRTLGSCSSWQHFLRQTRHDGKKETVARSPLECGVVGQPYETPYFHPRHRQPPSRNGQEQPGSGSTTSAPASNVSTPACANMAWPLLRPVSVAQKNKPISVARGSQGGHAPPKCLTYLAILYFERRCPKKILLLAWSQNIQPKKGFWFGHVTEQTFDYVVCGPPMSNPSISPWCSWPEGPG